MPTLTELREERGRLVTQMRALVDRAEAAKRDLTAEEEQEWRRLDEAQERLGEQIRRRERLDDLDRALATPVPAQVGPRVGGESTDDPAARAAAHAEAFRTYIRFGLEGLSPEQRVLMRSAWRPLGEGDRLELRALGVGMGAAGGFTVPEGFQAQLERDVLAFGGMREAARIIATTTGNDLPWPTVTDVANTGELLGENTQATEQDTTFGQVIFKAWKYSTKIVRVSIELLQDTAFDIEALLSSLFAERIARITNTHFTTGDNVSKPQGVVTAASVGKTGATGQTTSVTYDDLVDLEHSIDPAIRRRPGVRWMFHDTTLRSIKKLKDSQNRPLYLPGLVTGTPDTILGYPFTVNQDVAPMAANARSILFGDFRAYVIRDVRELTVLRLVERYADFGQVGFIGFSRHDGRLLDPGTDPVKVYQNSAT